MGQLALGLRSLAIRLALFFVFAAMLAWALGGTLWPRSELVDLPSVQFDGAEWFWQMAAGGREPGTVRYTLMRRAADDEEAIPVDERRWADVAVLVVHEEVLLCAGRPVESGAVASTWRIERRRSDGGGEMVTVPDRLAVEWQLARARIGLELLDAATIEEQRATLLAPGETIDESAIGEGSAQ